MNRRFYRFGGIILLQIAFVLFIILLRDLLLPRLNGTILITVRVNGQPTVYQMDAATSTAEPFGDQALVTAYQGILSPDGQHLAFWEAANAGNTHIVIADTDGSNRRVLTSGPRDFDPRWSPDGRQIVFVRYRQNFSTLFMIDVATGSEQQLTDYQNDLEPDWSPDGQHIVFTTSRDGFQELYTMAPDGSDLQRLTRNEQQNDLQAIYSPDGAYIAYMTNYAVSDGSGEIWLMNGDGSNQRRLTTNGRDDRWPLWSSDSTRLIFTSSAGIAEGSHIVLYDLTTDELKSLTAPGQFDYFPLWSPDDQWILFMRGQRPDNTLRMMRPDGSDLQPLVLDSNLEVERPLLWMQ